MEKHIQNYKKQLKTYLETNELRYKENEINVNNLTQLIGIHQKMIEIAKEENILIAESIEDTKVKLLRLDDK